MSAAAIFDLIGRTMPPSKPYMGVPAQYWPRQPTEEDKAVHRAISAIKTERGY